MCSFVHGDNWRLHVWILCKECNLAQAKARVAVGPVPQQVGPRFGLCCGTLHVIFTFIIMLPSVTMVWVKQSSRLDEGETIEQTGCIDGADW